MGFGSIYTVTWWGNVNEANSWGIVYPFNAEDSNFRADTTLETADTILLTADQTKY